eukprot:3777271-Amphidinium_carterae.1
MAWNARAGVVFVSLLECITFTLSFHTEHVHCPKVTSVAVYTALFGFTHCLDWHTPVGYRTDLPVVRTVVIAGIGIASFRV